MTEIARRIEIIAKCIDVIPSIKEMRRELEKLPNETRKRVIDWGLLNSRHQFFFLEFF